MKSEAKVQMTKEKRALSGAKLYVLRVVLHFMRHSVSYGLFVRVFVECF